MMLTQVKTTQIAQAKAIIGFTGQNWYYGVIATDDPKTKEPHKVQGYTIDEDAAKTEAHNALTDFFSTRPVHVPALDALEWIAPHGSEAAWWRNLTP